MEFAVCMKKYSMGDMFNAGDLNCILDKQNDIANGIVKGIKAYFMR